jgi:hypothetical protein
MTYKLEDDPDAHCQYCGTKFNLHRHHILYRSHGGEDSDSNLITLCQKCHWRVHDNPSFMIKFLRSLVNSGDLRYEKALGLIENSFY